MRVLFYIRASCFCVCDLVCFCVLSGEERAPTAFVCVSCSNSVRRAFVLCFNLYTVLTRTNNLPRHPGSPLTQQHALFHHRSTSLRYARTSSRSLWLPSPRQHTSLPSSLFTHSSLSFTHLSQRPSASPMSSVAFDRVYTPRPIVATTTVSEVGSYERPPIRTRGRSCNHRGGTTESAPLRHGRA